MTDRPGVPGIGEQLAAWGKVVLVGSIGRVSGRCVWTPVGFVAEADGSVLVAAGDPEADWALNLLADPRAEVELEGVRSSVRAEPLEGPEAHRAVRELILRYGTPAERLGAGPAFRLRPVGRSDDGRGPDGGP